MHSLRRTRGLPLSLCLALRHPLSSTYRIMNPKTIRLALTRNIAELYRTDETLFERVQKETRLDRSSILDLTSETSKFLVCKSLYPKRYILPSRQVDLVWHQLILHTELYRNLCTRHFGRFIDHRPLNTNPPFTDTITTLEKHFGPVDTRFWDESA